MENQLIDAGADVDARTLKNKIPILLAAWKEIEWVVVRSDATAQGTDLRSLGNSQLLLETGQIKAREAECARQMTA